MPVIVKPVSATLLKDSDLIGKQDPYIVIQIGEEKQQTKVCKGGGLEPTWDQQMTFHSKETIIKFTMYDDDFGKDDFLGQGFYNYSHLLSQPNIIKNQYIELNHKENPAGRLLILVQVQGTNAWGQPNQGGWGN